MTGVVCDGVTVVNVSQVTMEIESCEGCVRRVSGGESEPSGRYLHTAVLARVSEAACVNGGYTTSIQRYRCSMQRYLISDEVCL